MTEHQLATHPLLTSMQSEDDRDNLLPLADWLEERGEQRFANVCHWLWEKNYAFEAVWSLVGERFPNPAKAFAFAIHNISISRT